MTMAVNTGHRHAAQRGKGHRRRKREQRAARDLEHRVGGAEGLVGRQRDPHRHRQRVQRIAHPQHDGDTEEGADVAHGGVHRGEAARRSHDENDPQKRTRTSLRAHEGQLTRSDSASQTDFSFPGNAGSDFHAPGEASS
jgi:hypothetical protein